MPDVIHADQNADDRGLEVQRVLLPALRQLRTLLPETPRLKNTRSRSGYVAPVARRDQQRVARAEGLMGIPVAGATAVGDGIPLEQDAAVRLKDRHVRRGGPQGGSGGNEHEEREQIGFHND